MPGPTVYTVYVGWPGKRYTVDGKFSDARSAANRANKLRNAGARTRVVRTGRVDAYDERSYGEPDHRDTYRR